MREIGRFNMALTNKEVIVPDFALFKVPNSPYLHKVQQIENKALFSAGERVVVLSGKYFGYIGNVEEIGAKTAKVKLV